MNDWTVALWYRHPKGSQRPPFPGARDDEVYMVGPPGRREEIETLGRSFVAFLNNAGVELAPGERPKEFKVIRIATAN